MTATADSTAETRVIARTPSALDRAEGVELLGPVHGSGYREGAALVRRADGQIVQIGPLLYALLECVDGRRSTAELADALCEKLGRGCDEEHVAALAQKLARQGLLRGTEQNAPPRPSPLLALRWKVLVTDPKVTNRATAPFTFLFHRWIVWPVVAAFVAVCWFVLVDKGLAAPTADAFRKPGLLLLVFALTIASAAFHELGHAAACRYGGATPGGMGMGLYLVWPAFYTDVTDAYRLPRGDRLRVDLGGLYFNAVVSVATCAAWLAWHVDALLLLVGLQLLMMVKNLSPVIRSDGYHILADATGIPDLYAHIDPTLRSLLPWRRREPSALHGRARILVSAWVLVVVPVLLALMLTAVVLLPRLLTSAWDSGHRVAGAMTHEGAVAVLADCIRLLALFLPVLGSVLVTQKLVRTLAAKGRDLSAGRPVLRGALIGASALAAAGMAWAWWPTGQYQPVTPSQDGTLIGLGHLLSSPGDVARPVAQPAVRLTPGTHLALSMIPVGGVTKDHPALLVIPGSKGEPAVALLAGSRIGAAAAFPFKLPAPPGPGDTQALAVNTQDGAVVYDIAYALVKVDAGGAVTNTNSAYAFAHCSACTTVAVSFQVVLVVGQSNRVAPIDAAGALNSNCPACSTTAIADQIVVTLRSQPTDELVAKLQAALKQLDALSALGTAGTPQAIAAQVAAVQQQIQQALDESGQVATPATTASTATATQPTATTPAPATTAQTQTTSTTPAATPSTEPTTTATTGTSETTTTTGTTTDTATATTTDTTTTTTG